MSRRPWWTCTHENIGLPGCPTCDGQIGDVARRALREARDRICNLEARLDEAVQALTAHAVGWVTAAERLGLEIREEEPEETRRRVLAAVSDLAAAQESHRDLHDEMARTRADAARLTTELAACLRQCAMLHEDRSALAGRLLELELERGEHVGEAPHGR